MWGHRGVTFELIKSWICTEGNKMALLHMCWWCLQSNMISCMAANPRDRKHPLCKSAHGWGGLSECVCVRVAVGSVEPMHDCNHNVLLRPQCTTPHAAVIIMIITILWCYATACGVLLSALHFGRIFCGKSNDAGRMRNIMHPHSARKNIHCSVKTS